MTIILFTGKVESELWRLMHREYLKEHHYAHYADLLLTGRLWTYLAGLDEQVEDRMELIVT